MRGLPALEPSVLAVDPVGGFLPGEQVAVAIISEHIAAGSDGGLDIRALVELLDGQPLDTVVLIGRSSGNLVIGIDR